MPSDRMCQVCDGARVKARGRCGTCDAYWRKYGKDRSEYVIVSHGRRILDRALEADPGFTGKRVRESAHDRRLLFASLPDDEAVTLEQWRKIQAPA